MMSVNCYTRIFGVKMIKGVTFEGSFSDIQSDHGDFLLEMDNLFLKISNEANNRSNPFFTWNAILAYFDRLNLFISDTEPWRIKGVEKDRIVTTMAYCSLRPINEIGLIFPHFKIDAAACFGTWEQGEYNNIMSQLKLRLGEGFSTDIIKRERIQE